MGVAMYIQSSNVLTLMSYVSIFKEGIEKYILRATEITFSGSAVRVSMFSATVCHS